MKVYLVTLDYYDGDHDHGQYQSPLFLNRADAEAFFNEVTKDPSSDKFWATDDSYGAPILSELEINEGPVEVKDSRKYLDITYT